MTITSLEFKHMSASEIYDVLKLRSEVFVVEQNCIYQDLDDKDRKARHLCMKNDKGEVIGCCRVFKYNDKYAQIGRFVTAKSVRGKGCGKILMDTAIGNVRDYLDNMPIMIHAQSYAVGFYEKSGFKVSSVEFLEDDIPHREMIRLPE